MTGEAGVTRCWSRWYVLTILTGSFLLFLIQPMVARMALPRLGGAPAVWNSAMLVYQALLLGGYAYAHWLGRLTPRLQGWVHGAVLVTAALWLPIGVLARDLPSGVSPALWVPWLFGLSIGPLFLAVAAQTPLVQRWYAIASGGRDPYALYAASNLGSFAGLIAYPLLVEPLLALPAQSRLWSIGYLLLVVLTLACATRLPRSAPGAFAAPASPVPSRQTVLYWVTLAFVPSGLMLATSTYITTDILALPLLWVMPLGLYLLSFTIAFAGRRGIADAISSVAPLAILLFGGVMMGGYSPHPLFNAGVALFLLFVASVAVHTRLYRCRPKPDRLTGFYLAIALGGALGGVFAALIAPAIFDWTYEYPLLILAAGLLVPQIYPFAWQERLWTARRPARFVTLAIALLLGSLLMLRIRGVSGFAEDEQGAVFTAVAAGGAVALGARVPSALVLAGALVLFGGYRTVALSLKPGVRTRSYFGVYTVRDDVGRRVLIHGNTVHGVELTGSAARERMPTTYYVAGSGIGQAMAALPGLYGPHAQVGVVGLGSGTLACYATAGQGWRFYEIDPAMVRIARTRFRFLPDCLPGAPVRIGDARISLSREPAASLDLLALDAFSSDSIPVHLMTQEAFATYAKVVRPRGLLLVHVSNRFIDLEPVIAAATRIGGWHAVKLAYRPPEGESWASLSDWIALSRDPAVVAALMTRDAEWTPVPAYPGFTPWRDDFATVLPLMRPFHQAP